MLDILFSDPRTLVAGVDWLSIVGCIVVCIVHIVVVVVVVGRIVAVGQIVVVVGRIVVVAVAVVLLCLVDHLIGTCHPCHPSYPSFPSYLDTTCNTFASYMCSASGCYSSQLVPSMDIPSSCLYTYHQQQGKQAVEQPLHRHLLRILRSPSVRKGFHRQHCCTISFVLHHPYTRHHHRMEQGCCIDDFVSECHHHTSSNRRSMHPIHPSFRQHLEFHRISFQLLVQHNLHCMDC